MKRNELILADAITADDPKRTQSEFYVRYWPKADIGQP